MHKNQPLSQHLSSYSHFFIKIYLSLGVYIDILYHRLLLHLFFSKFTTAQYRFWLLVTWGDLGKDEEDDTQAGSRSYWLCWALRCFFSSPVHTCYFYGGFLQLWELYWTQFYSPGRRQSAVMCFLVQITFFRTKDFVSPSFTIWEPHMPLSFHFSPCFMVFPDKAAVISTLSKLSLHLSQAKLLTVFYANLQIVSAAPP